MTARIPTSSETDKFTIENAAISPAAQWHQSRRRQMLSKYSAEILPLEQQSHGLFVGLPLLILSNVALIYMSIQSAALSVPKIMLLAFPTSVFSLWQLQILHDALHSSLLPKPSMNNTSRVIRSIIKRRKKLQNVILFWGSLPSAFGYYLYLKYGHLTHHKSLGDPDNVSLAKVFGSTRKYFEDGDVLFTAHRMRLLGDIGPTFHMKWPKELQLTMSISRLGFSFWKEGSPIRNSLAFISSFMLERWMLILNDFAVAIAGKNFFFPNKPKEFHEECAQYCRIAVLFRLALCTFAKSWKPLLFLYFAETLWSIPPHPACAMFITNHGSSHEADGKDGCIPSSSTYAGRWYSWLTLGTNYHVEHHDFPTIPLHELGKLRKIAPEFYRGGEKDNIFRIMKNTFAYPQFYACMNSSIFNL
jgi:fatty acid desaturase